MKKKVIWDNKEFESIISLSKYLNVPESTLRGWLKKGINTGSKKGQYLWEGKFYETIVSIHKAYPNTSINKFDNWIHKGWHSFEQVENNKNANKNGPFWWEGVAYKNFSAIQRAHPNTNYKLNKWYKKGYRTFKEIEEYLHNTFETKKGFREPVIWNNKEYYNEYDMARELGVSLATISYWRSKKYVGDKDLKTKLKPIIYKGKFYRSIKDAALKNKLCVATIAKNGIFPKMSNKQISKLKRQIH